MLRLWKFVSQFSFFQIPGSCQSHWTSSTEMHCLRFRSSGNLHQSYLLMAIWLTLLSLFSNYRNLFTLFRRRHTGSLPSIVARWNNWAEGTSRWSINKTSIRTCCSDSFITRRRGPIPTLAVCIDSGHFWLPRALTSSLCRREKININTPRLLEASK